MRRQAGFTLIELLVVMGITSVLLTLSAFALRHYWFVQAIESAAEEIESELRQVQQQTIAESHPLVYGAWFRTGVTSGQYGILKFDPKDTSTSSDDECTQVGPARTLGNGVVITEAAFEAAPEIDATCAPVLPVGGEPVFFYARGSATPGDLTLYHAQTDDSRTVTVSGVTGRVEQE